MPLIPHLPQINPLLRPGQEEIWCSENCTTGKDTKNNVLHEECKSSYELRNGWIFAGSYTIKKALKVEVSLASDLKLYLSIPQHTFLLDLTN